MTKRRFSERLNPDEAAVVLPVAHLRHIAATYRLLAEDNSDPELWLNIANLVDGWVDSTSYKGNDDEAVGRR